MFSPRLKEYEFLRARISGGVIFLFEWVFLGKNFATVYCFYMKLRMYSTTERFSPADRLFMRPSTGRLIRHLIA
jgi:hypothetical protein